MRLLAHWIGSLCSDWIWEVSGAIWLGIDIAIRAQELQACGGELHSHIPAPWCVWLHLLGLRGLRTIRKIVESIEKASLL